MHLFHRQRSQTSDRRHQQGCRCITEQLARREAQQVKHKALVADYLVIAGKSGRTECFPYQIDDHIIEHTEK